MFCLQNAAWPLHTSLRLPLVPLHRFRPRHHVPLRWRRPFLPLSARMGEYNGLATVHTERLACIAAILLLYTGLSPRRLVVVLTSRFVVVLVLTVLAVSKRAKLCSRSRATLSAVELWSASYSWSTLASKAAALFSHLFNSFIASGPSLNTLFSIPSFVVVTEPFHTLAPKGSELALDSASHNLVARSEGFHWHLTRYYGGLEPTAY